MVNATFGSGEYEFTTSPLVIWQIHLCSCKSFAKIVPIPKNYISSQEHFSICTVCRCGRSDRWTLQHGNVLTRQLFGTGTGTFWHTDISASWMFCDILSSAHLTLGLRYILTICVNLLDESLYWFKKVLFSRLSTIHDAKLCFWSWHHHSNKTVVKWQTLQMLKWFQ